MDEDGVDRTGSILAACEHLLQFRAPHRTPTLAGIAIDADDDPTLARAVLAHLELLLFQGEPVFRLLVGGDANIEGDLLGTVGSTFGGDASAPGHWRSYQGYFRTFGVDLDEMKVRGRSFIGRARA